MIYKYIQTGANAHMHLSVHAYSFVIMHTYQANYSHSYYVHKITFTNIATYILILKVISWA